MKKLLVGIALALALVAAAQAEEKGKVWVSVMSHSYHFDDKFKMKFGYNQRNYGIGLEYDPPNSNLSFVGGFYRNSYHKDSFYASIAWQPIKYGYLRVGPMIGMISGYQRYDYNFGPYAGVVLSLQGERLGMNMIYIPPAPGGDTSVIGFQWKMSYN